MRGEDGAGLKRTMCAHSERLRHFGIGRRSKLEHRIGNGFVMDVGIRDGNFLAARSFKLDLRRNKALVDRQYDPIDHL